MNIPFWIIFGLLLAFELAASIPRGLEYNIVVLLYIVGMHLLSNYNHWL